MDVSSREVFFSLNKKSLKTVPLNVFSVLDLFSSIDYILGFIIYS